MTESTPAPLLDVVDIEVRYGAIRALHGISFHVNEGEVVALLGANGAGKTTTQKTISGMLRPTVGQIVYDGSLSGIIDKFSSHKVLTLLFNDGQLPPDIGRYGEVVELVDPRVKLRVDRQPI